jgi:hypothetical protein
MPSVRYSKKGLNNSSGVVTGSCIKICPSQMIGSIINIW